MISEIIETKNIEAIKVIYDNIMEHLRLGCLNGLDEVKRLYLINKYSDQAIRLLRVLIAL